MKKLMLALLVAGVAACDVINPADPVPIYLQVDSITVDPNTGTGTSQQKFTEVWVYINDNPIGAYSVPAQIPLLYDGTAEIKLFPGIRVNGIRSAADFYPFFEPQIVEKEFSPGTTFVVDMHTRYRDNIVIPYIEDFESSQSLIDDVDDDAATSVERVTTGGFEGNGMGRIILNDSASFIQVASLPLLTELPVNGTPVYLEMHYKNNVEFSVGLVGHGTNIQPASVSILVLRPQENWNKVYVELSPALQVSQLQAYQILFTAAHNPDLEQSEIYLDNLKIVHLAQ